MNGSDALPEIVDRLARLERQNRRLRAWMACLVGLGVAAAAAVYATSSAPPAMALATSRPAAVTPSSVQAREFRLLDRSNRLRAVLNMSPKNAPQLVFFDEEGNETLSIPGKHRILPIQ